MMRVVTTRTLLAVATLAAVALLAGCLGGNPLEGTEWKLTSWSVSSIDPATLTITAKFEGGQIGGTSAVNTYGGPVKVGRNGSFEVGQIAATEMASADPELNRAEGVYLKLLADARSYKLEGTTLMLSGAAGNPSLIFTRTNP